MVMVMPKRLKKKLRKTLPSNAPAARSKDSSG